MRRGSAGSTVSLAYRPRPPPWPIPPLWPILIPVERMPPLVCPIEPVRCEPLNPRVVFLALCPLETWDPLLPCIVRAFFEFIVAWLERLALLTSFPRLSPLSCAIFPQPCPPWCSATTLSKLCPVAFARRCAFSKLPQPSPVDALSACKVATGTPVAAEILSTLAAGDVMAPNIRINAARMMLKFFMVSKPPRIMVSLFSQAPVPSRNKNYPSQIAEDLTLICQLCSDAYSVPTRTKAAPYNFQK